MLTFYGERGLAVFYKTCVIAVMGFLGAGALPVGATCCLSYQEDVKKLKKRIDEKVNTIDTDDLKALAADLMEKAKEYQSEAKSGVDNAMASSDKRVGQEKNKVNEAADLLICVSLSMPRETLIGYLKQAKIYGAKIVVQGLINNSFKETLKLTHALVKQYKVGILLDPPTFTKYGVTIAPTIILKKGNRFDKVSGVISLEAALRTFKRGVLR